jgi:hypothetical protein
MSGDGDGWGARLLGGVRTFLSDLLGNVLAFLYLAGFLLWLAVIAWLVMPERWTNVFWYAVKYRASPARVTIADRPRDCDWMRAPLGEKGCRYEAVATVYNAAGQVILDDDTWPQRTRDKSTGKVPPDTRPRHVWVVWHKVEDDR